MLEDLTCESCGSKNDLFVQDNPFKPGENLWLCKKCNVDKYEQFTQVRFYDPYKEIRADATMRKRK